MKKESMKPIPKKIREQISLEIGKAQCARKNDGGCNGRLTVEHAFGRVKQSRWNLIFLCWYHHLGGGLDKAKNKYHAYQQATDDDLRAFKLYEQMKQEKKHLTSLYGK